MKAFYLGSLLFLLLIGCSFSEDELVDLMVTKAGSEEDCYNVYIVFESEEKALDGSFHEELSEKSKRQTPIFGPLHTWDRLEWNYTKAFNITEYPSFLVVDSEQIVLQTTNFQEVETFLSNLTTECKFYEN